MSISFECSECGKTVRAPDELAGRKVRCPHCANVMVAPQAEEQRDPPPERETRAWPGSAEREGPREPRSSQRDESVGERQRKAERGSSRWGDDEDADRPRRKGSKRTDISAPSGRTLNVLGVIAICLSGVAVLGAWIPFFGLFTLILTVPAIILALVGLCVALAGGRWGFLSPVIGGLLSILVIALPFVSTFLLGFAIFKRAEQFVDDATAANRNIEEANKLYTNGKTEEAVKLYKDNVDHAFVDKSEPMRRIVEFELDKGNDAEARTWAQKAVDAFIEPQYVSQKAKDLHAELRNKKWGVPVGGADKSNLSRSAEQAEIGTLATAYQNATKVSAADKRYKDKMLRTAGVVVEKGEDAIQKRKFVIIKLKRDAPGPGVKCLFREDSQFDADLLLLDQQVTIVGKCGGKLDTDIIMRECFVPEK
jgi:DNA-directed RNA polymerase subunit RPC12/RpoP